MKQFTLTVLVVFMALAFSSCEKDKADPTFDINDIIGTWELIGGDSYVACADGEKAVLEITATEVSEESVDDNGCPESGGTFGFSYEFKNGNTLDVGLAAYKVTKLDGDNMTTVSTSPLAPGVSETKNWQRKP